MAIMATLQSAREAIRNIPPTELADLAYCRRWVKEDSKGAGFLRDIATAVLDLTDDDLTDGEASVLAHAVADDAPNAYVSTIWQTFMDLAAWDEDIDDLVGASSNMTTRATVALFLIAERVAVALITELQDAMNDDDDDDDDDDDADGQGGHSKSCECIDCGAQGEPGWRHLAEELTRLGLIPDDYDLPRLAAHVLETGSTGTTFLVMSDGEDPCLMATDADVATLAAQYRKVSK